MKIKTKSMTKSDKPADFKFHNEIVVMSVHFESKVLTSIKKVWLWVV